MRNVVVKLDDAGHVVGVRPGPAAAGWIAAPEHVTRDPFSYRASEDGWVTKTEAEQADFVARHAPTTPDHTLRLRELRKRKRAGVLTASERDELLDLLLDQLT